MWIASVDLIFFSFLFNIFSMFFDSLYSKLRYGRSRIRIGSIVGTCHLFVSSLFTKNGAWLKTVNLNVRC